jgi:type IV pilus assembly protein PilO
MALADDLKQLSPKMKASLVGMAFVLIGAAYWMYLLQPSLETRWDLKTTIGEIEPKIAERERIANQKAKFQKEVERLREAFKMALAKLPDQREIPGLFHSVSLAGREAGMEFLLFEPKAAPPPQAAKPDVKANLKPSDQRADQPQGGGKGAAAQPGQFYEEIPVSVKISGGFNNTMHFFDKVSRLPRIVNIEEIAMGEGKDSPAKVRVIGTTCIVKTYMFLEKKEETQRPPDEKGKK